MNQQDECHPGMPAAMNALRKIAIVVCLLAGSAQSATRADVVYGNLGPAGTDALSDLGADFGPSAASFKIIGQGFTTGANADFLTLQGVTIGAFAETLSPRTVSIYTNAVGNVPGSLVATSLSVDVQAKSAYTFAFSPNLILDSETSYWVVPQFNQDWFWYQNEELLTPDAQNTSGYQFLAAKRSNNDLAGTWASTASAFSVSINAVPEPSSIMLGLAGVGGVALFRLRRRMTRGG